MPDSYDVIVAGSGAGGAAVAYKLVKAGKRVLMIEKGGQLPRDRMTLSTNIVFKEGRFANKTEWQDGHGKSFVPNGEHYKYEKSGHGGRGSPGQCPSTHAPTATQRERPAAI